MEIEDNTTETNQSRKVASGPKTLNKYQNKTTKTLTEGNQHYFEYSAKEEQSQTDCFTKLQKNSRKIRKRSTNTRLSKKRTTKKKGPKSNPNPKSKIQREYDFETLKKEYFMKTEDIKRNKVSDFPGFEENAENEYDFEESNEANEDYSQNHQPQKKKNRKTQFPAVKIPKGKKIFNGGDGFLGGADESEASDEEYERSAVDSSSNSDASDSFINMDDFFSDHDTISWELEPTELKANIMVPEQNETPKVNLQLGPDSDPIDFFLLIFDKKIITDAVAATNQYHRAKPSHKQGLIPHGKVWKDIQDYEMARFLGLLYLMGILKKSVLRDYWSIDPLVETPSFRFTMTRDRFSDIANHFRLYEESRMDRKDPLYKIRHFINQIIENSRKHYTPSRNLSLDESMISYKGRNRFKMYMPNKPTRFGFKAYVVADACSGFALSWEMHSFTKNNPFSLRETIIRLLAPYRNSGFFVYMDRFYTSPEIVAELAQQGINVCGTVLSARLCLPDSVREDINTLNHLEYKHFKAENQRFAVLRDGSKFVYLLSSFHGNFAVESMRTLRKREKKKDPTAAMLGVTKRKVVIPQMIVDYNKYMGGVDRLDQCISTYCYAPRTLKWQMRVFYYFLDIAMFNSYVIYKKKQQEAKRKSFLTHKEFRIEVIRSLIGINKLTSAKRIKLLMKAEAGELSKEFGCTLVSIEKPRECQICSGARNEYNKKIRTQFMCKTCQMPVCIRGCYDKHYREAELGKTNN